MAVAAECRCSSMWPQTPWRRSAIYCTWMRPLARESACRFAWRVRRLRKWEKDGQATRSGAPLTGRRLRRSCTTAPALRAITRSWCEWYLPKAHEPATTAPAAFAASIHVTDQNGTERRIVSDHAWSARAGDSGTWIACPRGRPSRVPLSAWVSIEQKAIAGPDRIVTDASLFRKDFSVASKVRSARLR